MVYIGPDEPSPQYEPEPDPEVEAYFSLKNEITTKLELLQNKCQQLTAIDQNLQLQHIKDTISNFSKPANEIINGYDSYYRKIKDLTTLNAQFTNQYNDCNTQLNSAIQNVYKDAITTGNIEKFKQLMLSQELKLSNAEEIAVVLRLAARNDQVEIVKYMLSTIPSCSVSYRLKDVNDSVFHQILSEATRINILVEEAYKQHKDDQGLPLFLPVEVLNLIHSFHPQKFQIICMFYAKFTDEKFQQGNHQLAITAINKFMENLQRNASITHEAAFQDALNNMKKSLIANISKLSLHDMIKTCTLINNHITNENKIDLDEIYGQYFVQSIINQFQNGDNQLALATIDAFVSDKHLASDIHSKAFGNVKDTFMANINRLGPEQTVDTFISINNRLDNATQADFKSIMSMLDDQDYRASIKSINNYLTPIIKLIQYAIKNKFYNEKIFLNVISSLESNLEKHQKLFNSNDFLTLKKLIFDTRTKYVPSYYQNIHTNLNTSLINDINQLNQLEAAHKYSKIANELTQQCSAIDDNKYPYAIDKTIYILKQLVNAYNNIENRKTFSKLFKDPNNLQDGIKTLIDKITNSLPKHLGTIYTIDKNIIKLTITDTVMHELRDLEIQTNPKGGQSQKKPT